MIISPGCARPWPAISESSDQPRSAYLLILGQQRRAEDTSRGNEYPIRRVTVERVWQGRHLGCNCR